MPEVHPDSYLRRSPIYRILAACGAHFGEINNAAVAMTIDESHDAHAGNMGIADLTPLPRTGFKGRDTPQWLTGQGVQIPTAPNRARRQRDGTLVARLSNDEHVFLSDLDVSSTMIAALDKSWQLEPGRLCFSMPRAETHAWFALTGECSPEMLSKVCGVDTRLHKFSDGAIAQTSVARINGILIRNDLGTTPAFYVLADSASADFLWPCLIDALQEFDGAPIGLETLRMLSSPG